MSRLHAIAAILDTLSPEQQEALRPHLRALVEEGREAVRTKDAELAQQTAKVAELERRVRLQALRLGELQEEVGQLRSQRHLWRGDVEAAYRAHNETRRELEDVQGDLEAARQREAEAIVENINLTMALTAARQEVAQARAIAARVRTERLSAAAGRLITSLSEQLLAQLQAPWKRRGGARGIVAARTLMA